MSVQNICRFLDEDGEVQHGEAPASMPYTQLAGLDVTLLSGDLSTGFSRTATRRKIKKVLCPLESAPIIICVGLNYRSHAQEAKMAQAKTPIIFTKPTDALAGPYDDISVHPCAQSELDYEAELAVIIGKDAKNVTEEEALEYVFGYAVGNDVSARNYQVPEVCGNQFCYAKSFDGFAPIGPCIVTKAAIPDPQEIRFTTKVNGELRQQSGTHDMIFTVRQIIAHLTQGTTLRKGTVIMTGTPAGVGIFMNPKGYIQNGDVVEIEFQGIGTIANKFTF